MSHLDRTIEHSELTASTDQVGFNVEKAAYRVAYDSADLGERDQ